jgi:hypothetical protein
VYASSDGSEAACGVSGGTGGRSDLARCSSLHIMRSLRFIPSVDVPGRGKERHRRDACDCGNPFLCGVDVTLPRNHPWRRFLRGFGIVVPYVGYTGMVLGLSYTVILLIREGLYWVAAGVLAMPIFLWLGWKAGIELERRD